MNGEEILQDTRPDFIYTTANNVFISLPLGGLRGGMSAYARVRLSKEGIKITIAEFS